MFPVRWKFAIPWFVSRTIISTGREELFDLFWIGLWLVLAVGLWLFRGGKHKPTTKKIIFQPISRCSFEGWCWWWHICYMCCCWCHWVGRPNFYTCWRCWRCVASIAKRTVSALRLDRWGIVAIGSTCLFISFYNMRRTAITSFTEILRKKGSQFHLLQFERVSATDQWNLLQGKCSGRRTLLGWVCRRLHKVAYKWSWCSTHSCSVSRISATVIYEMFMRGAWIEVGLHALSSWWHFEYASPTPLRSWRNLRLLSSRWSRLNHSSSDEVFSQIVLGGQNAQIG